MSNRRSIFWLSTAIAVMALAHLALSYKGGESARLSRRSVLVDDLDEKWTRITIEKGGTNRIAMAKGRYWRLEEPYASSVDEAAVKRMLDALSAMPIEDSMSDAELLRLGRVRRDFRLDPPVASVILEGEDGKTAVSFGALTPSGKSVYASVSGVNAVFVVSTNTLAAVDRGAGDFRRRTLFVAGPDEVSSFTIRQGAKGVIDVVRDGDVWTAGGHQISERRINEFLGSVMGAAAVDFIWPTGATDEESSASAALLAGYGLDAENAITVTMKCIDGVDRLIAFGKPAKEGLVYALAQNAGAVVTVSAALKDAVMSEGKVHAGSRIFPQSAAAVSSFSVSDGPLTCSVARGDSGAWRLDAPISAPADPAAAESLLARILALTGAEAGQGDLKVEVSPGRETAMVPKSGILGGFRLEDLRSKEILRVDPLLVKRLVLSKSGAENPVSVVYDRDRKSWNVERSSSGGSVDVKAVGRLVAALDPLVALSVVKLKVSDAQLREYGLDRPVAVLAVDQNREDALRRNLLFGVRADGGGRYVTLGISDAVFIISDETFSVLTEELTDD